jgi:coproporphyrinogen III oxidase-like Fe-S oxidoreductase
MLEPDVARTVGLYLDAGQDVARVRYANPPELERWLRGAPAEVELLTAGEAQREDIMLGMRLAKGVSAGRVAVAGLGAVLESLAGDGLVELADGRWRTTTRGWLLGNEVFGRIWAGE